MQTLRLYVLQNRSYCRSKFCIAGMWICALFALWPWSWPDDLHIRRAWPVSRQDVAGVQKQLSTSSLSKVIVLQTDRQTRPIMPRLIAGGQKCKTTTDTNFYTVRKEMHTKINSYNSIKNLLGLSEFYTREIWNISIKIYILLLKTQDNFNFSNI